MNPIQIIATLRKFGNYLAGLFPGLAAMLDRFANFLAARLRQTPLYERGVRLTNSEQVKSVWKVVERFYWRNYAKDRLHLEEQAPENLVVLRPVFQLCAFLCISIPLSQFHLGNVAIETFSGYKSQAPAWAVVLWTLTLPCAWAVLLAGCAMSNRIVFSIAGVGAAYFLSTCVLLLPRDYSNLFLTAAIFFNLFCMEKLLPCDDKRSKLLSFFTALVVGGAAGIQGYVLTPLKPLITPLLPLQSPEVTLLVGGLFGAVAGMLCRFVAHSKFVAHKLISSEKLSPASLVWLTAALLAGFSISAALRGGLSTEGGAIISSVGLTNTYLWPIWYFVGIGIVHKLVGSSKAVTSAVEVLIPEKILPFLLIALLIFVSLVCNSTTMALALSNTTHPLGQQLFFLFEALYRFSKSWLWSNPLLSIAAEWFNYVLLFDLLLVSFLAIRRKITAEAVGRIFYITCLAALLIWEYLFQLSSFTRTPTHSVIALFFFAAWLLWLMHTVGWARCIKSSPAWPSRGRLAIFAGILTLALLEIHSRAAASDFGVVNEMFLVMFRGVIDVGLPYFLFVWVSKKLPAVPITTAKMLALFSLGALAALLFNVLDKLGCTNYVAQEFFRLLSVEGARLSSTGNLNIPLLIPAYQLVQRAILYVCFLVLVGYQVRRRTNGDAPAMAARVILALMAFGSGVASFSHTLVDLPVPLMVRVLTAPLVQETTFSCNVVLSYLAYWIPATIIGIAYSLVSQDKAHEDHLSERPAQGGLRGNRWLLLVAGVFCIGFNFAVFMVYGEAEAHLRATDTLYPILAMGGGIYLLLVIAALKLMITAPRVDTTVLSPRAQVFLILVLELCVGAFVYPKSNLPLATYEFEPLKSTVSLPSQWQVLHAPAPSSKMPPTTAAFKRTEDDGTIALLHTGLLRQSAEGSESTLKTMLLDAAKSGRFPNLRLLKLDQWNRFAPNAIAGHYSYDMPGKNGNIPMAGLTVLVPASDNQLCYFTLFTSPSRIESEQWEIALAVKSASQAQKSRIGQ